jgi:hypothetical protein
MQNQRVPNIDSQTIDSYQTDGVVLLKGCLRHGLKAWRPASRS